LGKYFDGMGKDVTGYVADLQRKLDTALLNVEDKNTEILNLKLESDEKIADLTKQLEKLKLEKTEKKQSKKKKKVEIEDADTE